jgi:hypothetical protein
VCDIADDSAWISIDADHDTLVFAVATIEQLSLRVGPRNIRPRQLLVTATTDASNGHPLTQEGYELARVAATTELDIPSARAKSSTGSS